MPGPGLCTPIDHGMLRGRLREWPVNCSSTTQSKGTRPTFLPPRTPFLLNARVFPVNVVQNVATDEECLKQANSLIMLLKADVRALNACAARLLTPSEAEGVTETPTSEVALRYGPQ